MKHLIGSNLGTYRIIEQIGMGGMATVFKAFDPGMKRYVAVKVLPSHYSQNPEFVKRFKREARVIANLEHPHILPVYSFGEHDGTTYLAMRYLAAGTLKDLLLQKKLTYTETARLIRDIAAALDFAHTHNIVHRDIKPSNILIDQSGIPYLMDFGLAKILEGTTALTESGAALGTPEYIAPEQALGLKPSPQSDIYALGVMLYEMVTGQVPFQADTPLAVALKHIHDPLPLPREINPELSPEIENVILKALAKEPSDRYEKASDLADAFEEAIRVEAPQETQRPPEPEKQKHSKPQRRWGLIGGLAILILVGALTTAILLRPKPVVPAPMQQPAKASGAFQVGRTLFQDDFEDGPSPLWDYQWEPWETKKESGNTYFVANLEQAQETRLQGAENWTNYLLRFDLKFAQPNPSGFYNIGIKTRIAECTITHEQYYGISIAPDLLHYAHDDCGAIKNEQVFNIVLPEEDWHTFEIINLADRIQAHVNGDQIIDIALEEPILQGSIAFENYQEGQIYYIDNVVVYELKAASEE
jgi:serine/threonine protein kinase